MIRILRSAFSRNLKSGGVGALARLVLVLFLAVALQIQTDIAHIRVNLADPVLPLAGVFVLVSLILHRSFWPQWDIPKAYLWLAGLCIIMGLALLNGWWQSGELSSWALYNKFTGFLILVCYFALGGWLVSNRRAIDVIGIFVAGFLVFYLVVHFGAFVMMSGEALGLHFLPDMFQFEGFAGNRNAYGVLMIGGTVILVVFAHRAPGFLPRFVLPLYLFTLPLVAGINGSRALWIVLLLVGLYFLARYFRWALRYIMPPLFCGALLVLIVFSFTTQRVAAHQPVARVANTIYALQEQGPNILNDVKEDADARKLASELIRVRNAKVSLGIWRDHPLIGGGLGAILAYQYAHYDPEKTFIDVMDCTPIWLLAETGLVGLLAFVGFYGFVMRALWRKVRHLPEDKISAFPRVSPIEAAFAEALIIFMLAFGIMSLFHEIMYTRYLWVMMGMGAAIAPLAAEYRK